MGFGKLVILFTFLTIVISFLTQDADAVETVTWDGEGDGINWSDSRNWSGDPSSARNIIIDGDSAVDSVVHLDINFQLSGTLTIDQGDKLVIDEGKTLTNNNIINVDGKIELERSFLVNNGSIELRIPFASLVANEGSALENFDDINNGVDDLIIIFKGALFNNHKGASLLNSGLVTITGPSQNSGRVINTDTGTFKIVENESPRPQDRVYFSFNFFENRGTVDIDAGAIFTNDGKLTGGPGSDILIGGSFTNSGELTASPGSDILIGGSGTFFDKGGFFSEGLSRILGEWHSDGSKETVTGTSGTFSVEGTGTFTANNAIITVQNGARWTAEGGSITGSSINILRDENTFSFKGTSRDIRSIADGMSNTIFLTEVFDSKIKNRGTGTSEVSFCAFCDMTVDGGGWTLLIAEGNDINVKSRGNGNTFQYDSVSGLKQKTVGDDTKLSCNSCDNSEFDLRGQRFELVILAENSILTTRFEDSVAVGVGDGITWKAHTTSSTLVLLSSTPEASSLTLKGNGNTVRATADVRLDIADNNQVEAVRFSGFQSFTVPPGEHDVPFSIPGNPPFENLHFIFLGPPTVDVTQITDPSGTPIIVFPPKTSPFDATIRSAHAGGINVALADGSVRFINSSIDMSVFMSLGTYHMEIPEEF